MTTKTNKFLSYAKFIPATNHTTQPFLTPAELFTLIPSVPETDDRVHEAFIIVQQKLLSFAVELYLSNTETIGKLPSFSKRELGGKFHAEVVRDLNDILGYLDTELQLINKKGRYHLVRSVDIYSFPETYSTERCEYIKAFKSKDNWIVGYEELDEMVTRDRVHCSQTTEFTDSIFFTMLLQRRADCIKVMKMSSLGKTIAKHRYTLIALLENCDWEMIEDRYYYKIVPFNR